MHGYSAICTNPSIKCRMISLLHALHSVWAKTNLNDRLEQRRRKRTCLDFKYFILKYKIHTVVMVHISDIQNTVISYSHASGEPAVSRQRKSRYICPNSVCPFYTSFKRNTVHKTPTKCIKLTIQTYRATNKPALSFTRKKGEKICTGESYP